MTIVVPMLNEAASIGECLDGFAAQTWDHDRLEVLVVDGGSSDGSRSLVAERAVAETWVQLLDNPRRVIPAACNIGWRAAAGDIVCFFSAHGVPAPTFVAETVRVLTETGAAGVGGRYRHEGGSRAAMAIGLAMASPFGMASPHRFSRERLEVDTISHPAYWRTTIAQVGGFDEGQLTNEDYDLNWRIRERGGRLVFDPSIESIYRPRGSLRRLARQFHAYGRGKARLVRKAPRSMRPRHLVPPAATLFTALSPALLSRRPGRALVAGAGGVYLLAGAAATARLRVRRHQADPLVALLAFPVMHGAWGTGFLRGLLERR